MAPEQAAGLPCGPAADWYSVGVLLYEALTGRLPFDGKILDILTNKQRLTPPPPSSILPQVPSTLDQLCMELLRIEPAARPDYSRISAQLQGSSGQHQDADFSGSFFVGRDAEIKALWNTFDETRSGQARMVLLHGESGAGKSALMRRFAEHAEARATGLLVLQSRCYEHETVPFKAIDGLIDGLARTLKRWSRSKVEALLPRKAATLLQAFPVLGLIPTLAELSAGQTTPQTDPHEQRSRVFAALRELLGRLCERQPLLLLIDDLQWTDADSLALLSSVVRPPDEPALMIVATVRSDASVLHDTWLDQRRQTQRVSHVSLQPLSESDAMTMAAHIVGADTALGREQLGRLVAETQGHPLFVQELVRYAVHHKSTAAPRLEEALWARICDVPEASQELLGLCAVMGTPLSVELATRASFISPDEVERAIRHLRSASLLRVSAPRGAQDYSLGEPLSIEPYHDRVREVVVERMSPAKRRERFERLADVHANVPNTDPEVLVYLFDGAGDRVRAGSYAIQAADNLMQALAFERAANFYGRAISSLSLTPEKRRALQIKQADALVNAGRGYEAGGLLVQAAEGTTPQERSDLRRRAGEQFVCSGHYQEGVALIRKAFQDLGLRFNFSTITLILSFLIHQIWLRLRGLKFRVRKTEECSARMLAQIDLLRATARRLGSLELLLGADISTRWLLLALRVGEPSRVAAALSNHATALSLLGTPESWERAQQELSTSKQLINAVDDPKTHATLSYEEGVIHGCAGNFTISTKLFNDSEALFSKGANGGAVELAVVRAMLLENYYYLGQMAEIDQRIHRYLEEADSRHDRFYGTYVASVGLSITNLMHGRGAQSCEDALHRLRKLNFPRSGYLEITIIHWKCNGYLYDGNPREAMDCRKQEMPTQSERAIQYVQKVRVADYELIARCALAVALKFAKEKNEMIDKVKQHIRAIDRERRPWADALCCNLRACLAHLEGDTVSAAKGWGTAAELFDKADMSIHAAVARRRKGQVIGGETGRTLIAEEEAQMRNQGIESPSRWTAMHAPANLD